MASASDFGSEGWGFESLRGRFYWKYYLLKCRLNHWNFKRLPKSSNASLECSKSVILSLNLFFICIRAKSKSCFMDSNVLVGRRACGASIFFSSPWPLSVYIGAAEHFFWKLFRKNVGSLSWTSVCRMDSDGRSVASSSLCYCIFSFDFCSLNSRIWICSFGAWKTKYYQ